MFALTYRSQTTRKSAGLKSSKKNAPQKLLTWTFAKNELAALRKTASSSLNSIEKSQN